MLFAVRCCRFLTLFSIFSHFQLITKLKMKTNCSLEAFWFDQFLFCYFFISESSRGVKWNGFCNHLLSPQTPYHTHTWNTNWNFECELYDLGLEMLMASSVHRHRHRSTPLICRQIRITNFVLMTMHSTLYTQLQRRVIFIFYKFNQLIVLVDENEIVEWLYSVCGQAIA